MFKLFSTNKISAILIAEILLKLLHRQHSKKNSYKPLLFLGFNGLLIYDALQIQSLLDVKNTNLS